MDCMDFVVVHNDFQVDFPQILVDRSRVVDRWHGDNHCWDHMDLAYIRHLQELIEVKKSIRNESLCTSSQHLLQFLKGLPVKPFGQ